MPHHQGRTFFLCGIRQLLCDWSGFEVGVVNSGGIDATSVSFHPHLQILIRNSSLPLSLLLSNSHKPTFTSPSFCRDFARSPCVCVGFGQVLWFPPSAPKHGHQGIRFIGSLKSVNGCVNGCSSLDYMWPSYEIVHGWVDEWREG